LIRFFLRRRLGVLLLAALADHRGKDGDALLATFHAAAKLVPRPYARHMWRVLDPACGSGIFLVAMFNLIAEQWRRENSEVFLAPSLPNVLQQVWGNGLMYGLRERSRVLPKPANLHYTYCVIAHIRDVLRGMVELLQLGSVATAFFPARHAFEWTAHTCLMSRELKDFITKKDWKGARELQSRVMEGNRWVKDYGTKYVAEAPGDPYDQMPDGLRVKNALRAYEKY
jgi:hypothetical protein